MTSNILIWKCQLLLWTYVYARTQGKVSHSPRPPGHSWDGLYVFVWRWTFRCSALIWCLALSKTGRIPDLRISEYTQSSKLYWRTPLCSLILSSYVNPISNTQKGTCFLTECPQWLVSYQHLPSGFSPKSEPESPGCPCPHLAYVAKGRNFLIRDTLLSFEETHCWVRLYSKFLRTEEKKWCDSDFFLE